MSAGEQVRASAFWAVDWLRGGKVAKHLQDLARFDEDPTSFDARRAEQLGALLAHACETTEYYRQFRGAKLADFPVLQKRTIRENYGGFLSSAFSRKQLRTSSTRGSYGTPMTFYLTKEKKYRQNAEVIKVAQAAGYEVGCRHAYIVVSRYAKRPLKADIGLWMCNQVLMNPTRLTDEWLARQGEVLRKQKMAFMVGYPVAMAAIAAASLAAGFAADDYHLRGIVSMAEPLQEEARQRIEAAFGCPVLDRFSTEELGLIGQECLVGKQYHVNQSSLMVELLHPSEDRPVPFGELGRLVVTDLWSQAMPLIRYDIGDMAVMAEKCACGWPGVVLSRLEGRTMEMIYNTNGTRISPFAISSCMRDAQGIIQFQFVQRAAGRYTLRLVLVPGEQPHFNRDRMLSVLGPDAELMVECLPEIPPLASGKRPFVINAMPAPGKPVSAG